MSIFGRNRGFFSAALFVAAMGAAWGMTAVIGGISEEQGGSLGDTEPQNITARIVPFDQSVSGIPLPDSFFSDETCVGFLVVEMELPQNTHLYSVKQPVVPGGAPTVISVRAGAVDEADGTGNLPDMWQFGAMHDACVVHFVPFFDNELWQIEGSALLAAPVFWTGDESESVESIRERLSTLSLEGTLDGLLCDDSTCRPVTREFLFTYDAHFDLEPVLVQVAETSAQQQEKLAPPKNAIPTPPSSKELPTEKSSAGASAGGGGNFAWRELFFTLFFGFFGGMILNVMPCVLPVIGLKILSFFEQAGHSRARAFALNFWYSVGIFAVFTLLAVMSVGLSFLFTHGLFQIVMGGILFGMALNLIGVWEIALPGFFGGRKATELMTGDGSLAAVFKGIITTLLAIPCGAPLLSPALVWTDTMIQQGNSGMVLAMYWVIALGMATPYLVVGAFPELLRFLPKPGAWMETVRNIMGFVLLVAVVWILYSMPAELILPTIPFLFSLWFACWWIGRGDFSTPPRLRNFRRLIAVAVVLGTVGFSYNIRIPSSKGERWLNSYTLQNAFEAKLRMWAIRAERSGRLIQESWALFSQEQLETSLAENRVVLVDFTADWCTNCKVLEATVLSHARIEELLRQKKIVTLTADWTMRDQTPDGREVGNLLRRYGGEQVPVLMLFTPEKPDEPTILRGFYTVGRLEELLEPFPDRL